MLASLKNYKNWMYKGAANSAESDKTKMAPPAHHTLVRTNYTSNEVAIPDDFLTTFPPDSKPISVHPIDFANTVIPEYAGCYAVVLENVLSPSECLELLSLAEQSVVNPIQLDDSKIEYWKPAMVNAGPGYEILAPDYRNSDRIIWDNQVLMDRLLERCFLGEGIKEQLSTIEGNESLQMERELERGDKWRVTKLNERQRYLRYGPGQFFRAHCDGAYTAPGIRPEERTFYTLHLYLNDSKQTVPDDDNVKLEGGATSFLWRPETMFADVQAKKRIDVDPKTGRVLIFQHKKLYHAGADVTAGIKYTMRSDLMFQKVVKDTE